MDRFTTTALLESGEQLPTPLRLTPETIDKLKVEIQGYTFLNMASTLVCPECGKISGLKATRALDDVVDYFLVFGCEHYKNDKALTDGEKKAIEDDDTIEGEVDED